MKRFKDNLRKAGSRPGEGQTILLWICMFALLYAIFEGSSFLCLRLLRLKGVPETSAVGLTAEQRATLLRFADDDPTLFFAFSPTLGWVHRPSAMRRAGGEITNAEGLRATQEFPVSESSQLRVAAFGDSFTYGDEVANPETWEEQMMALQPTWAVLNAGVTGYGVDQALLRYEEMARALGPQVVLIGFMVENINRSVNTYRPFYDRDSTMTPKPRFAIDHGRLVLLPNPIRTLDGLRALANEGETMLARLGAHDYFFQKRFHAAGWLDFLPSVRLARTAVSQIRERLLDQPITSGGKYNVRSEAYRVTEAILQQFDREVVLNGSLPVIVLFPDEQTMRSYRRDGHRMYQPLEDDLKRNGLMTLDLLDGLNAPTLIETLFGKYHYSPLGNRIVAQQIISYFLDHHLDDPGVRAEILKAERQTTMSKR